MTERIGWVNKQTNYISETRSQGMGAWLHELMCEWLVDTGLLQCMKPSSFSTQYLQQTIIFCPPKFQISVFDLIKFFWGSHSELKLLGGGRCILCIMCVCVCGAGVYVWVCLWVCVCGARMHAGVCVCVHAYNNRHLVHLTCSGPKHLQILLCRNYSDDKIQMQRHVHPHPSTPTCPPTLIHTQMHVHKHPSTHTQCQPKAHPHPHIFTNTQPCTYTPTHTHAHPHPSTHTYMHTHTHPHMPPTPIHTHTHAHPHMHTCPEECKWRPHYSRLDSGGRQFYQGTLSCWFWFRPVKSGLRLKHHNLAHHNKHDCLRKCPIYFCSLYYS